MELTYPINLIGCEAGSSSGDVLSRHGEYLGTWAFIKDEDNETGVFHFVADGELEPKFSERVNVLSINMHIGMAMSNLCSSIEVWHEEHG